MSGAAWDKVGVALGLLQWGSGVDGHLDTRALYGGTRVPKALPPPVHPPYLRLNVLYSKAPLD